MPRFTRVTAVVTLLATSACTQPAAQIDLKGQNSYSRNSNGSSSYASNYRNSGSSYSNYVSFSDSAPAPRTVATNTSSLSQPTTQTAAVQSIGVSDLPPPSKTASVSAPEKPQTAATSSINRWTGKPHFESSDESSKSTISEKPVAQLDKIMSKDSEVKNKDYGKPVSLITPGQQSAVSSSFIWPVNSKKVLSGFGPKGSGKVNDGLNIASAEGEPVWAASDGEVVYVGNELQGYGNMVLIKHSGNKTTTYAHLNRATVDKYDRVKQGDIIGYVGQSGNVDKPQLHFAVRNGKEAVDPNKFLKRSVAGL